MVNAAVCCKIRTFVINEFVKQSFIWLDRTEIISISSTFLRVAICVSVTQLDLDNDFLVP